MDIIEDPQLKMEILSILSTEYQMLEPREGIHGSDLIYCLTRSYWNKVDYLPPSELDLGRFSIGLGLERVIIRQGAERVKPFFIHDCQHEDEVHDFHSSRCSVEGCDCVGVYLSPDFLLNNIHSELKTTRWGVDHEIPPTWLKQVMSYLYAVDHTFYNLVVLHIIQAKLRAYRLFFTQDEIEENWGWMLERRDTLVAALELGEAPPPFTYNEDWECNGCKYKLRCDLSASLIKMERGRELLRFQTVEPLVG